MSPSAESKDINTRAEVVVVAEEAGDADRRTSVASKEGRMEEDVVVSAAREVVASVNEEGVEGETSSSDDIVSKPCICCGSENAQYQCTRCKVAKYCSKKCQRDCWEDHKTICDAIHKLSKQVYSKETMFRSHISPAKSQKIHQKNHGI